VNPLTAQVEQSTKASEQAKRAVSSLQSRIPPVEAQVTAHTNVLASLAKNLTAANGVMDTHAATVQSSTEQIAALSRQLQAAKATQKKATNDFTVAKRAVDGFTFKQKNENQKLAATTQQLKAMNAQLAVLQKKADAASGTADSRKTDLQKLQEQAGGLRKLAEDEKSALLKLQEQNYKLIAAQNAWLKQQLADVKRQREALIAKATSEGQARMAAAAAAALKLRMQREQEAKNNAVLKFVGRKVAMRNSHGKFLSMVGKRKNHLLKDVPHCDKWEHFNLIKVGTDNPFRVAIQSNTFGMYIGQSGSAALHSAQANEFCMWILAPSTNGSFTFTNQKTGGVLCQAQNGSLQVSANKNIQQARWRLQVQQ
jgi:hypothetical protein